jgi:hypothetical protein
MCVEIVQERLLLRVKKSMVHVVGRLALGYRVGIFASGGVIYIIYSLGRGVFINRGMGVNKRCGDDLIPSQIWPTSRIFCCPGPALSPFRLG